MMARWPDLGPKGKLHSRLCFSLSKLPRRIRSRYRYRWAASKRMQQWVVYLLKYNIMSRMRIWSQWRGHSVCQTTSWWLARVSSCPAGKLDAKAADTNRWHELVSLDACRQRWATIMWLALAAAELVIIIATVVLEDFFSYIIYHIVHTLIMVLWVVQRNVVCVCVLVKTNSKTAATAVIIAAVDVQTMMILPSAACQYHWSSAISSGGKITSIGIVFRIGIILVPRTFELSTCGLWQDKADNDEYHLIKRWTLWPLNKQLKTVSR